MSTINPNSDNNETTPGYFDPEATVTNLSIRTPDKTRKAFKTSLSSTNNQSLVAQPLGPSNSANYSINNAPLLESDSLAFSTTHTNKKPIPFTLIKIVITTLLALTGLLATTIGILSFTSSTNFLNLSSLAGQVLLFSGLAVIFLIVSLATGIIIHKMINKSIPKKQAYLNEVDEESYADFERKLNWEQWKSF